MDCEMLIGTGRSPFLLYKGGDRGCYESIGDFGYPILKLFDCCIFGCRPPLNGTRLC